MDQHPVPQDITGFKFKLVGDMTVKQFGELAFGAVMAYLFFASNWHPILKWPFVLFFTLFGIALAFLPIAERPLDIWIINFFRAIYRPTYYVWKKSTPVEGVPAVAEVQAVAAIPQAAPPPKPKKKWSFWPFSKDKEPKGERTNARPEVPLTPIPQVVPTVTTTPPPPAPVAPVVTDQAETPPAPPVENKPVVETKTPSPEETGVKAGLEAVSTTGGPAGGRILSVDELLKLRENKGQEKEAPKPEPITGASSLSVPQAPYQPTSEPQVVTIEQLVSMRQEKSQQNDLEHASSLSALETRINDLTNKHKSLLLSIDQVKGKLVSDPANAELSTELTELTNEKNALSAEISELYKKASDQRVAPITSPDYQQPVVTRTPPQVRVVPKPTPKPAAIVLTDLPNIVNGLVMDSEGRPIEGVILIIRDKNGNSIRALKTNRVGQFIVSTPLENGMYYLEMEKAGLAFDTLEVTLSGQVLSPIEIKAKGAAPGAPA